MLNIDLTTKEVNLVLDALSEKYERIRVSRSLKWRPSTKAIAMSEISRIRHKVAGADLEAKREAGKIEGTDSSVRADLDEPVYNE